MFFYVLKEKPYQVFKMAPRRRAQPKPAKQVRPFIRVVREPKKSGVLRALEGGPTEEGKGPLRGVSPWGSYVTIQKKGKGRGKKV
jgi:hypothetical protein